VLDALNTVKWYQDGTLTFRRSCAHGICGSDAMRINGVNRLACKVLMRDVGERVTIEPLMGFRVIKDLVVDMEPFFAQYRSVLPYLINDDARPPAARAAPVDRRPRALRRHHEVHPLRGLHHLLPVLLGGRGLRRPGGDRERAPLHLRLARHRRPPSGSTILNDREGVWRCRTIFNCTEACPREIRITKAIGEVKKAILYGWCCWR
jgi:succinate dehydrogenase / fumarate reductase, iron-sulfur subunit